MGTRYRFLWFFCAVVALFGCVAPVVSLRPASQSYTAQDYEAVYERWTRGVREFDFARLRGVLNATATFESPEFRWAYVVRYAEDFGLPPETRTALLRDTLADAQQHHRFFVTLGDGRPRDVDLTGPQGAFRVVLLDDRGRQSFPIEVTRIPKPSIADRTYFSSVSSFRQAFRVVFPATHDDGQPTLAADAMFAVLRFTGPKGQVDLKWEFRPGASGPRQASRP